MRKMTKQWMRVMTCCLLGLLLFVTNISAQGQNLLTNPGFEAPFETFEGSPPRQVAQGWLPWHIGGGQSASENVPPEYYPASDVANGLGVPRIRSGNDAQQYHSFFATHDGGILQRVTSGLKVGDQLRFSVYAYIWSSTFDNPDESEDDGGVVFQIGIDPNGGTNGESRDIIWSAPSIQYDAYNDYSVIAIAARNAVTVFIRSTVSTPVQNNNIYVDDAALVVVGAISSPTSTFTPSNTSVPPTTIPSPSPSPTVTDITPTSDADVDTAVPVPSTATYTSIPSTTIISSTIAPVSTATPTNTSLPSSPSPTIVPSVAPTNVPISSEFPGRIIHIVQTGDKVVNLAALYGSSIEAIIEVNGLSPSAFIRVGQPLIIPVRLAAPATSTPTLTPPALETPPTTNQPVTGTTSTYVVQPGDTLSRIAARFNTSVAALAQLNGIANPNIIRPGQRLVIPVTSGGGSSPAATQVGLTSATPTSTPVAQSRTYVVQPGDTLFRIALRFQVAMSQIAQVNNISDFNRVYVGQILVIP